METDIRTEHESQEVTKGEKRGMNMWLYQYNYRNFWLNRCATIELSDGLHALGKAATTTQPQVTFKNRHKKALHIFEACDRSATKYHGAVEPGDSMQVPAIEGNVLQVKADRKGKKVLMEHSVL